MTMFLSNREVRPTGFEAGEFLESPAFVPPPAPNEALPEPGAAGHASSANEADNQLQFLQDLVDENASIAGDVLDVGDNLWAIHGFIPVDGEVLMAEFHSYDQAARTLEELSLRSRRHDFA